MKQKMTNFTRIALLFVILLSSSCIHASGLPDISIESNRVLVCAHRANCGDAPENSLAAIKACIEKGVDIIEIDVRKTKDGKLVLIHDAKVDRMTNGLGEIKDMNWEEVSKLHLYKGDGKQKILTKEKVPSLEEALELCKDKIYVNLDMKGPGLFDCAEVIKKTKTENIIMHRGTSLKWLKRVSAEFPRMIISPRFDFRRKDVKWPGKGTGLQYLEPFLKEIKVWGVDIPLPSHPATSKENLKALKKLKVRVWIYTLWGKYNDREALKNPDAIWGKLIDRGISVIMTDESEALIKYLKSIHRH